MKEFERIYENKTTIGYYHKVVYGLCCTVFLVSGCFLFMNPFLTRYIQIDLDLTFIQTGTLGSTASLGGLIGGFTGTLSLHVLGRKTTILLSTLIGMAAGITFYFANDYFMVVAGNFLSGLFFSTIANSIMIYIIELLPAKARSKLMVYLLSSYSIGRVVGSVVAWATLQPYEWGLWRWPLILASGLLALVFPGMLFFMKESVKYSFMKGRLDRAHQDFSDIQELSLDKNRESSLEKVLRLSELTQIQEASLAAPGEGSTNPHTGAMHQVMTRSQLYWMIGYFALTIVTLCCIATGHAMSLSNLLGSSEKTLVLSMLIMLGEFVAIFICAKLIDHPQVGRKRLIVGSLASSVVFFALAAVIPGELILAFFLFLTKISIKCALSTGLIHQAETIPSHIRDKVLPMVSAGGEAVLMLFSPFFFKSVGRGVGFVLGLMTVFCVVSLLGATQLHDDLLEARLKKQSLSEVKN